MGSKNEAPSAPDYSGVAAASAESAKYAYKLGQDQLAWAKKTYAADRSTTNRVVNQALRQSQLQQTYAAKDRQRYEQVYQPLENQYIEGIKEYTDPGKVEQRAGEAAGDVSQQFEQARQNAQSQLETFGVDPSQTRAAALDLGTRTQEAAARASAANISRRQDKATATGMLGSAIDIGRGYPGQAAQAAGLSLQAGSTGANTRLATSGQGSAMMAAPGQYIGLGNSALGQWGNALNLGYSNQLNQYNANQSASSGLGGLLGTGLGIGTKLMTGGLFEEGGMVPEDDELPSGVTHSGIPVTPEMSPSHGRMTDDIPAVTEQGIPARINAGEFIVPEDTVRWFGEKHMQSMIEKGRKEQSEAKAKPRVSALPV